MMTPDQLSALLKEVNVKEVSRLADVSTKTIYRLRNQECVSGRDTPISPTLRTVERLVWAVKKWKRGSRASTQQAA